MVVSFTCTHHLEKFVENGKLFLFFVVSFSNSIKKKKKKKTMNINSKRKKNPGKEINHLLFFIVGKVAILSTFFDWRKSMYSEVWTLKKLYSKFWSWLAGVFRHSKYQDVSGYSGNIRENIGFRPKMIPNRAHHLRRRQVFSVAYVYPIVPATPSSSSSRLLYPDIPSLLLMNFLITMPLFFFIYRTLPLYFFYLW